MSIFEYDEEKHMRTVRSEGFEDGLEQGIEQKEYQVISRMLREDLPAEVINRYTGCSVERIKQIGTEMLMES